MIFLPGAVMKNEKQGVLLEVQKLPNKDNPKYLEFDARVEAYRENLKGKIYDFALEHPELCPPIGTVFYLQNEYGVKAKLTVKMVLRGLPGTEAELLPMTEQLEHLRDSDILAEHMQELGQPGFTHWANTFTWELWQRRNGHKN